MVRSYQLIRDTNLFLNVGTDEGRWAKSIDHSISRVTKLLAIFNSSVDALLVLS